ncbi:MAG: tRNA lysidine(34) synthetase TilS [Pseudomonadota bacterium]
MASIGRPDLAESFEQALTAIATHVAVIVAPGVASIHRRMAIAYSGGLDSTVLLHLAHAYASKHQVVLHAFHIHHGLSEHADAWLAHCHAVAAALGVVFDSSRITVATDSQDGIESSARSGRYAALGALCRAHSVPLLLTGHHQDDQAETVLLQLLRGSGVAGLSGMDRYNYAPDLLGDESSVVARPMLDFSRAALQAFANDRDLKHIDDPSNLDRRYARNALRHDVMPTFEAAFPGFTERFARSARHARSAQQLLIDLACQDLAQCADGDGIAVDRLQLLSVVRCENLLRYWFGSRGMRMPSSAWLQEMREQVLGAKADAQILVGHADCDIHRHRNRIVMTARNAQPDSERLPKLFVWDGTPTMRFTDFGGSLHFEDGQPGVEADWLRRQNLILQPRSGGWRLKLAFNRPTRSLKYHYQAADIPAWERPNLPLVTVGTQLLFAAGIGMDCHHLATDGKAGVVLRWQADR